MSRENESPYPGVGGVVSLPAFVTHATQAVPKGDPRFHALLAEIGNLHDRKQMDYGADADPFANVRAAGEWGILPWIGCLIRMSDKVRRLQKLAKTGRLANESAEDSMLDIAVYALIALILYREQSVEQRR